MTARKMKAVKVKPVKAWTNITKLKAWANITKRGRIDTGLISSVRMLIASRGRSSSRLMDKPIRVSIRPITPRRGK